MLHELRVRHLGVIEDATVVLGQGLTALTGETGAGKTLIVDAISLLLGEATDPAMVRPGTAEALVEGRFSAPGGEEVILARAIPAAGRSRAYLDGRMASAAQLAEAGRRLIDLHGQHGYQTLLGAAVQRALLDRFAGIDSAEVAAARRELSALEAARKALGGDSRSRAREMDLLRFQLQELDAADLRSADEDDRLRQEEELLAGVASAKEAATAVHSALAGDGGACDQVGNLLPILSHFPKVRTLAHLRDRLAACAVELADVAQEARIVAENLEEDPGRLDWVGSRRRLLGDLRRKYGDTLEEVISFREATRTRLEELESYEERAARLEEQIDQAKRHLAAAEQHLWEQRTAAAPVFAGEVQRRLAELAMPAASFSVRVDAEPPGEPVTWMLSANPGEPELPLSKVASGGELARTMLAVRLAVQGSDAPVRRPFTAGDARRAGLARRGSEPPEVDEEAPATLVFDEVDAGVGGEAAVAVGRALADLATRHQVLVVTHLPQVAACADRHLVVRKRSVGARTVAEVFEVDGADRVTEMSRMLSGRPASETARRHAEELLAQAKPSLFE